MDSSVTPVRHGGLSLVQTTDFFYPLVDDPYMMGKKEDNESKRAYKVKPTNSVLSMLFFLHCHEILFR